MAITPDPAPTPAQLVTLAEIVMEAVGDAESMVKGESTQAIADAKWARTLTDIEAWADLADDIGDVKKLGSIEFFENKTVAGRLEFRNKIRRRYGYPELSTGELAIASGTWF